MLTEISMNPISTNRWTHWDPLNYYACTVVLPHFLLFLFLIRPATLAFVSFFVFPILPVTSFKKNRATETFPAFCLEPSWRRLWAEFVCEAEDFSQRCFFAWSTHFKEFWLRGNLFNCRQIWTADCFTHKPRRKVSEKNFEMPVFSSRAVFVQSPRIFISKTISKIF